MTAEVVRISGDMSPEEVLERLRAMDIEGFVCAGWLNEPDENGNQFFVLSSFGDIAETIYALQQANLGVLLHNIEIS